MFCFFFFTPSLYPSSKFIFTQTVWLLSECRRAFKVLYFLFIYFQGNVRSRCSWHSVELTRSGASKTCLLRVGRCKLQRCLSPFGVKEVMYYAAAAQWVMLCEEPVCGPDRVRGTTLRRLKDSTGCLNPFVPNLFRLEWALDMRWALYHIYLFTTVYHWAASWPRMTLDMKKNEKESYIILKMLTDRSRQKKKVLGTYQSLVVLVLFRSEVCSQTQTATRLKCTQRKIRPGIQSSICIYISHISKRFKVRFSL